MPTSDEYYSIFTQAANIHNQTEAKTISDLEHRAALTKKSLRDTRDKLTKEISKRWKEQFALIKKENDDWQAALKEAYEDAFQSYAEEAYKHEGELRELTTLARTERTARFLDGEEGRQH